MYSQILEKIISIMSDQLCLDTAKINENSRIKSDLDINSLELLNVIIVIEEEFEILVEEQRLEKIKTVGDIARYVVERTN